MKNATIEERFWEKVNKTKTCWIWVGSRSREGHGQIRSPISKKIISAHRWSYEHSFGEFDKKLCILHKCDNPPCVRPDHLFIGTQQDNMRDCLEKGRYFNQRKKECLRGHKYNDKNTYFGKGKRQCRICVRLTNLIRKLKNNKTWIYEEIFGHLPEFKAL